jgi:glycosyltransferase involved in cell wall biosynthesis
LFAFIDADDIWTPGKLASQIQKLYADTSCEAVLGGVKNFISPELDEYQRRLLANSEKQTGNIHIGTLLIRRDAFQRIGLFDTRWRHGEFIEWWARANRNDLYYTILPEVVLRRRLHADNLTRREKNGRMEYLPILRDMLLHRRAITVRAENSDQ